MTLPTVDPTVPVRIWWDPEGDTKGTPWRVYGRDGVVVLAAKVEILGPCKFVARRDLEADPFPAAPRGWVETWGSVSIDGVVTGQEFAVMLKQDRAEKRWAAREARKLDKAKAAKVEADRAPRKAKVK